MNQGTDWSWQNVCRET